MKNWVSVVKTQSFDSLEEWNDYKKKHLKDTRYHKYILETPYAFPCVGIEVSTPEGDLGTITRIEVFVDMNDLDPDL
jgi:hypothetical protein